MKRVSTIIFGLLLVLTVTLAVGCKGSNIPTSHTYPAGSPTFPMKPATSP